METKKQHLFETKVTPLLPYLHRLAVSITKHKEKAEDLVQRTMLKAFQNWERFDYRSDVHCRAWVITIMNNEFLNMLRTEKNSWGSLEEEIYRYMPTTTLKANPERALLIKNLKEDMEKAINELPKENKTVMTLRLVEERSYSEIAEMTGLPMNKVKKQIYAGRKHVQKCLKAYRNKLKSSQ